MGGKKFLYSLFVLVIFWGTNVKLQGEETAIFAGGCFWCIEHVFDEIEGVTSTTSGYIGGTEENPSYEQVSAGDTGHVEAVQVGFNPDSISYEELLQIYWRNIDPTRDDGQFCDNGPQYRPVIFYLNEEQKKLAEASKVRVLKTTNIRPIKVEVLPATPFYPAEEYHQNYHKKNPLRYNYYRYRCGRDDRLEEVWGDSN